MGRMKLFKVYMEGKLDGQPVYVVASSFSDAIKVFSKQYGEDWITRVELFDNKVLV